MQLEPHDIHIWSTRLTCSPQEEEQYFNLLSLDEKARATRFHFAIHKQRYTHTRATLRKLISQYIGASPEDIQLTYNSQKKPSLAKLHDQRLHFNVSHSDNMAIFAFTLDFEIGVDIEKISTDFNRDVAKRYFSQQENIYLEKAKEHQAYIFYQIWAKKEAIIKATGKGLYIPLNTFSVSLSPDPELVPLEQTSWSLISLSIDPAYAAAVATNQKVHNIRQWVYNSKE